MSNYNFIAPIYGILKRIVFGNSLEKAENEYLNHLISCQRLTIIGGGNGLILKLLLKADFKGEITYIEPSIAMTKLAKKQVEGLEVNFITHPIESVHLPPSDGIITHFFLDQFTGPKLHSIIQQINESVTPQGTWLIADFDHPSNRIQHILIKVMYRFFKVFGGIEANELEKPDPMLERLGLIRIATSSFCKGFVYSSCWKKL